jgi:phospholipid/cholesterol/gamma-HCH transport system substrate-binding protein
VTRLLLRRLLPLLLTVGLIGVGVAVLPSAPALPVVATFDDVRDLVRQASVRVADVPVGTVTAIEVTDDHRARVSMRVPPDTGLPRDVEAVLRSTSVLGERYVELRPVPGSTGTFRGGEVTRTSEVDDIEDLVATGSELFGLVAADRLARAVEVGAIVLTDRGARLGTTIGDLEGTVAAYAEGREDLGRLIDATDRLLVDLAPEARSSAAVLDDLDRAARALDRQDEELFAALEGLSRLARVGADVLAENGPSIDRLLARLHGVAAELTRLDGAFRELLRWLPAHNIHVANGLVDDQSQVWADIVVCGVHDEPENPANSCRPPNPGRTNDPPPGYEPDDCDHHHEGCPYPEDVEPHGPEGGPGGVR